MGKSQHVYVRINMWVHTCRHIYMYIYAHTYTHIYVISDNKKDLKIRSPQIKFSELENTFYFDLCSWKIFLCQKNIRDTIAIFTEEWSSPSIWLVFPYMYVYYI